ncbi:putative adenosine kinase [Trypanosoma cruzi]|uniref:Adenosine kinase n=2 Tax=Trypanosoma cruzi TaxID=5693 RepID=Q4E0S4_TRYCC|nr:adenosine kinase, putative [Trypanosoma cruzi]EAN98400.1 adenosine kinase, putative [Trypanosoma cruzi]PWV13743.1 putative adenosine kinase [Trypanosoma cruzi]|eukprot:XP_820251.1 adenosine kinase [Trypanosoma cruzi strain CL Brener]
MSHPAKLYVQCNPLLDVSAGVSDEFMARYKVEHGTATLLAEEQAGIFEDLENLPEVKHVPGGSGLNTCRVAQWMLQAPKGSFVTYVGCIADDRYGGILKNSAEKDGVKMVVEYTTREPTGSCAVCITGKERSLVANLAAANCLSAQHIYSPDVEKCLMEAKLFYLTGFTLTIDVAYVLHVAKKAREVGGTFMMNLSAPFLIEFFWEQFSQVLPYVDIIFGNELEARTLSKAKGWDEEDMKEVAKRALKELPYSGTKGRLVVFTKGPEPTICVTKDEITVVPVDPLDPEKMIDFNGAGDAFVGGFLSGYALGKDLTRCCILGHYAAGVVIQHDGCTYPEKPILSPWD